LSDANAASTRDVRRSSSSSLPARTRKNWLVGMKPVISPISRACWMSGTGSDTHWRRSSRRSSRAMPAPQSRAAARTISHRTSRRSRSAPIAASMRSARRASAGWGRGCQRANQAGIWQAVQA
jgi:hypothetical protein